LSKDELERKYKLALQPPSLLVTFHPVTREYDESAGQIAELLAALERCDVPIIFTLPNADTHGRLIADRIRDFVNIHSSARLIENFGARDYWSVMSYAGAMVGNSSSGLIEAPSLKLPVVNIGNRQRGRERARNVIDVGYGRHEIIDGIRKALDPVFREGLRDLVNPYGSGNASEIIVERLRTVDLSDRALLAKRFCDIAC
jgi:UDP-hydrolysing UDP-N-acetyl-D-glucosamine 2-epimerase